MNILGEAILGEEEAETRLARILDLIGLPSVDYVSVKISSICPQLDVIRFTYEVDRISRRLRRLYDRANGFQPSKFVNLDMEEFQDLELTLAVFQKVLDEEPYERMGAGVALQAYLPDSLPALEELCRWAQTRYRRSGGWIKVRLVKGANLAMEHVEAEVHGWTQAPFLHKEETDAHYKRLLDVALDSSNEGAVRIGVASHNLFELAWAATLAAEKGVTDLIEFEMLEGMAPATAKAVAAIIGKVRLYTPIVQRNEIETAIAYLVRRLDENSSPENFLPNQFSMELDSPVWRREAARFRRSVEDRRQRPPRTRRTQDRSAEADKKPTGVFFNEPDTDFVPLVNRRWAQSHLNAVAGTGLPDYRPVIDGNAVDGPATEQGVDPGRPDQVLYRWRSGSVTDAESAITAASRGQREWGARLPDERRKILLNAAEALVRARGPLLAVMAYDTGKTLREGDPEVSEAIDFARYYAEFVPPFNSGFEPYGTVVVSSPWNFPLSIPAGGVLGALAAGNSVILKPSSDAVAVAGELSRVLWDSGVPGSALHFVPSRDRAAARTLIAHPDVDAVVLTGSWETARMFLGWRPALKLHAETSGKNAIVITATADRDEAIADLVRSAFGHAGQKCSAASLAIVEASVYDDPRFLRRVADAARTLDPGPGWNPVTSMGPLIRPPEETLWRALSSLEPHEEWLVRPEPMDEHRYLWRPGVKIGVAPGSWFHQTECFGPVLGIMRARDLEEAISFQNATPFGLTAGLHALDPAEIDRWRSKIEAGNLYVNRGITGAIVRRQPFGGWKRSVIGAGAKAGGPNYVASLGRWKAAGELDEEQYAVSVEEEWQAMREPTDPTGLTAESNVFRYMPLRSVLLCRDPHKPDSYVRLALAAANTVGSQVTVVSPDELTMQLTAVVPLGFPLTFRSHRQRFEKVRLLCDVEDAVRLACIDAGLCVDDTPVLADPRQELKRWTREQTVSESRHRHGDVTGRRPGLAGWPPEATYQGTE